MMYKQWLKSTVAVLILVIGAQNVFAASYQDVSASHWAYSAIDKLSNEGIMVGDSSGNFDPDKAVDKFYTAKVLAKLAGFRYVNLTEQENSYIAKAYDSNKMILEQFKNAFSKWDATADKEISYLLEKGILIPTDLNQFVVRMEDGTQRLRALSKEEYCTFLVRLMGRTSQAATSAFGTLFQDDSSITLTNKADVYYLKNLGVVSGDSSNNFGPKTAVTKATMAVMTSNALEKSKGTFRPEGTVQSTPQTGSTNTNTSSSSDVTTISSISGTIYKVYPSLNAVQITLNSGSVSTYKLSSNANIYIGSELKTIHDLKEGMSVTGIVSNSLLAELRVNSTGANSSMTPNTTVTNPKQLEKIEGTISALNQEGNTYIVTIKVPSVNAKGIISYEQEEYEIAAACRIRRDGVTIPISEIVLDEVIYAQVENKKITSMDLEKKDVILTNGKLIAKRFDSNLNKAVLTVSDSTGKQLDFIVTGTSYISRDAYGKCSWSTLRVGDQINLTAEFSNILELYAVGTKTTVTGWINEILISDQTSQIKVREEKQEDSPVRVYTVDNGLVDIYGLTLGSEIQLKLDSEEVESVIVINEANSKSSAVSGYIGTVRSGYISIVSRQSGGDSTRVYLDENTKIFDAVSGESVRKSFLESDMEVYVTVRMENGEKFAKTITIVDYNN